MKGKWFALLLVLPVLLAACSRPAEKADWPLVWTYADGSCQNTHTRALVKMRVNLIQWADPMSCTLAGGTWQSWGRDLQLGIGQAMVVPLVTPDNAVRSGAKGWSREQQIAFINDMDNLIILDPVSVEERMDAGPELWLPIPRFRCEYGQRWQQVKQRYRLSMTRDEKKAVAALLAACPAR